MKNNDFKHYTVMLNETVNSLNSDGSDKIYIDATLGGGGHSELILKKISPNGKLISFDLDEDAIQASSARLKGYKNIKIINRSYGEIQEVLNELGIEKITGGIIFDLGASFHQFNKAERGFSFQKDAPLDMRFGESQTKTAADVVNTYSEKELTEIFSKYGEERFSKTIARAIVNNRPINTTLQLADLICKSTPRTNSKIHPATKVFQALRIEVNNELLNFENTLNRLLPLLSVGAIISVISFHSLEDRIVKNFFKKYSSNCRCPIHQAKCTCEGKILELVNKKPILPTEEEISENPPSRSAKLRVAKVIKVFNRV
ncbi:16S rRNA (cytosine(1402)-N(4))-methyltransferase RsmH [bacterium]|nr:16S rRNA (cytosine(1402)-N(4))-methyltransferase RsmH [bacterium]